ncbi:MAG: type II toxin-antitoxin system VapC family toxin [Candidatus Dormibacteraeota bacterium]|nr:type II toxin-antitoxin system VapC family toxin [Candidatus Dormibacteraeota bacterium]
MTFVLDASIALAWCFADQTTAISEFALDRLGNDDALVPGLWALEVADVLVVAERRGRLNPAQTARFLELLRQLPITVEEIGRDAILTTVLDLARSSELTAYDAPYLALAAASGVPLATGDAALRRAALAVGVDLVMPSEGR